MADRDQRFTEQPTTQTITQEEALESTDRGVIIESPSIVVPIAQETDQTKQVKWVHHVRLLDAYCENPHAVTFQTQEPNEKILLFLRKTQIVNIPWITLSILLALLPPIIFSTRNYLFPFAIPMTAMLVFFGFYYLLVITYAFVNFIIWYFNIALITNKRIIDVDFHQLVYKDVAETKLSLVQDVSYRQASVIQNMFDHGHVLIQTAGTIENFEFDALPKPEKIVELVENLIGKGRVYVP